MQGNIEFKATTHFSRNIIGLLIIQSLNELESLVT